MIRISPTTLPDSQFRRLFSAALLPQHYTGFPYMVIRAAGQPHWIELRFNRTKTMQGIETMENLELKGNWNEVKGKLKQKYAQLTDDDLMFSKGKQDEMLGRLQRKLGTTREEIRAEIEWLQIKSTAGPGS